MSAENFSGQDDKAARVDEKARLEALSIRLSTPRQSALLDSLERVEGGIHKETFLEKLRLIQAWRELVAQRRGQP